MAARAVSVPDFCKTINNPNAGPKRTRILSTQIQAKKKDENMINHEEGKDTINPKSSPKMVKTQSTDSD